MARNSRKSSSSKSGGSTLFGMLAGLIIGLAIAAGLAYYVTKAPMPFVDKVTREKPQTQIPSNVDPNGALYSKDDSAPSDSPLANAPRPLSPGEAPAPSMNDEIGALLVTLGAPEPGADKKEAPAKEAQAAPPSKSAPASPAPKTSETSKPAASAAHPAAKAEPAKPAKPASTQTTYYLQAGAYRSANDADAVKAQILMLGLPVQVQKAQVNGATINRVRVGPFKGIDEMNRSRARLSEAKIDSSVVRP
jgi:cell division protein FtsN